MTRRVSLRFEPRPAEPEQLELPSDARYATAELWREKLLPLFARAEQLLTAKELGYACDVSVTQLADAIAERDRKGVRLKWLAAAAIVSRRFVRSGGQLERDGLAARDALRDLLRPLAKLLGCELIPREEVSDRDRLACYEAELARFGQAGAEAIARARGRGFAADVASSSATGSSSTPSSSPANPTTAKARR